jgi:hypothetical protein
VALRSSQRQPRRGERASLVGGSPGAGLDPATEHSTDRDSSRPFKASRRMKHQGPSRSLLARASPVLSVLASLLVAAVAKERGQTAAPLSVMTNQSVPNVRPAPLLQRESAVPGDQRCKVQVRFWEIGKGFYHAYILTSDSHGATHFRAGPASPDPLSSRIWAFLERRSPNARHWGPLRAEHGPYLPGTVDYDSGSPPAMTLLDDGPSCGVYNLRLTGAEIAINSSHVPYNPLTTNCNAFVRYALSWIHVTPGAPPVTAPGWYTILRPEGGGALAVEAHSPS